MLRTIFVAVLLAVGIVASLWNRFAALLVYVWFALFRPQEWMWVDVTSLRLSLLLGALLVIPSLLTGIFPAIAHPLSLGAIATFGAALVAQVNAVNPDLGWIWIDQFGRLILVSLFATTLVNTPRRFILLTAVIAFSIGFHSGKAGVAFLIGGGVQFYDGLAGAFVDNNGYALAIAMIVPFLISVWQNLRTGSPIERWAARGFLVAVPFSMLTVIGTFSRSGFLALGLVMLLFVLMQRRRAMALVIIVLALAVALPFVPLPKGYLDRIETIQTYEEENETSALSRLHFWQVATEMVKDKPLGIGLRNFESTYDRYDTRQGEFGVRRSVHSSHFQVLAELGMIGAVAWLGLFGYAGLIALRVRRYAFAATDLTPQERTFYFTSANMLLVSMAGFIVGGAFIALALNDLTWYTFAMTASLDRMQRARALAGAPATAPVPVPVAAMRPAYARHAEA